MSALQQRDHESNLHYKSKQQQMIQSKEKNYLKSTGKAKKNKGIRQCTYRELINSESYDQISYERGS